MSIGVLWRCLKFGSLCHPQAGGVLSLMYIVSL